MPRAGAGWLDAGDAWPEVTWPTVAHGSVALPDAWAGRWGVLLLYRGHW
jgi:hypothetical protein